MEKIAIIGMSGAFPGAGSIYELWGILCRKEEGLSDLDRETLLNAGVTGTDLENPAYVPRGGFLDGPECFDNDFFAISPQEALVTDPQQRLFLTHSWLALEDAGYEPGALEYPVGVFAGEGATQYWFLLRNGPSRGTLEDFRQMIGNDKDYLATRTSYKLNLTGPSINVQTACSTGLVSVGLACQSLLTYGCDMALAGGVTVSATRLRGYTYFEGMIFSRSGKCKPFDKSADGTVFGEGVAVVCLKRLSEAQEAGDFIYAIIDSVAINNDGSNKVGFTAPGYKGQSEAIELAHAMAGIQPQDVGFVETHGTGTQLGDPIEIQALTAAFGNSPDKEPSCVLGSIKGNIGHLDIAAGVVSLIKTALVVHTGIIPPLMHFTASNPLLGLESSRFRINKEKEFWPDKGNKRIAGVSSFGVGGTNAHAIVEGPPSTTSIPEPVAEPVILLSAKSRESLEKTRQRLSSYIQANPDIPLDDITRKYSRSRHDFRYRWGSPARDTGRLLQSLQGDAVLYDSRIKHTLVFMFPGQGSQFSGMASAYYGKLPVFTTWIDRGLDLLQSAGLPDFRKYLFDDGYDNEIAETEITQPLLYIIEFSLASELVSRGILPDAVVGHSIGEYAAAALAGVFSFEDGLSLVIRRAYWMQQAPKGAMTAVSASVDQIQPFVTGSLSISAINAGKQLVLSGLPADVDQLEAKLLQSGLRFKRLKTKRAFHSRLMDGILGSFAEDVVKISYGQSRFPFLSNLDGSWLQDTTDWATYWKDQLRNPVQFKLCLDTIAGLENPLLLEVGPGRILSGLAGLETRADLETFQFLPDKKASPECFDEGLIHLWERGCPVSWKQDRTAPGSLVLAPGYSFIGPRFWPEPRPEDPLPGLDAIQDKTGSTSTDSSTSAEEGETGFKPEEVYHIWERILGCKDADPDSNFFESGGDSLIAVQLLHALRQRFKIAINVADFLREPTLHMLLNRLSFSFNMPLPVRNGQTSLPSIIPRQDKSRAPLSSQQERLWLLYEIDPDKPLYNLVHVINIDGQIDAPRLRLALKSFFDRHDVFRTFVEKTDDRPHLTYRSQAQIPVEELDYSVNSLESAQATFNGYLKDTARIPVPLSHYPLVKASICHFPEDSCRVCLFIPHILSDGWSSRIFLTELQTLYCGCDESKSPLLHDLTIQYGDYSTWEHEKLSTSEISTPVVEFWQDYLKGIPESHGMPLDRSRPKVITGLGSTLHFQLDDELSSQVRSLCDSASITPNMFFLACLALLVRKYQEAGTVVIGTPYANREQEEVQKIFGYFIRTIPLRFDVDEAMDTLSWFGHVKNNFLAALEHSSLGIDELVKLIDLPRYQNINPIYQIFFTFQSYGPACLDDLDESGLRFTQIFPDRGISENDIALYMWEADAFAGAFEYSTDLFGEETTTAFMDNFIRVVKALSMGFNKPLHQIDLMDHRGWQIVTQANNTGTPSFLGRTFPELFSQAVRTSRHNHAVKTGKEVLSYADLDVLSSNIAARILASGTETGACIGIYLHRDYWLIPSLIGVFKAGKAYVPLDPQFPPERLSDIIADAGIRVILTTTPLAATASRLGSSVQLICLDTGEIPREVALPQVLPDSLAYVLFTSGSTGKPKGVPISHAALANLLLSMRSSPGITAADTVLALTTISFDISTLELFLPLICGAQIVLVDEDTSLDNAGLVSLARKENVTFIQATPTRWSLLLEAGFVANPGVTILTGGEELSGILADRLLGTGAAVWNMYGPTETTVWSSLARVKPKDSSLPGIGTPVANTQFYVLDRNNCPLPPGFPGELGIGGAGLSSGYLNRPDLNQKSFIEMDEGGTPKRVYKTGDLVQQLLSGNFRYLGRNDNQVKVRGFRIELGEIESAMASFPGVKEAVCTLWIRSETDKRIVAYYRCQGMVDEGLLKDHLQSRLPDYMLPGHYIKMESFPQTSSGKTDRKALQAPADLAVDLSIRKKNPPSNDLQLRIFMIWQEILGRNDFGISDSFFDLGGHSLLAARLIWKMNAELGNRWQLRDIFEHPTIETLAVRPQSGQPHSQVPVLALNNAKTGHLVYLVVGIQLYHNLALQLEDTAHCFGTFLPAEEALLVSFTEYDKWTVSDLASAYRDVILKHSQGRELSLIGISFGGVVAYELARQLTAKGVQVSWLVMLESLLPSAIHRNYVKWFGRQLDTIRKLGIGNAFTKLKSKLLPSRQGRRPVQDPDTAPAVPDQRYVVYADAVSRFEAATETSSYGGKTLLVRALDAIRYPENTIDPDYGWLKHITGEFHIESAPGDHLGILAPPNVDVTAAIIKKVLQSDSTREVRYRE